MISGSGCDDRQVLGGGESTDRAWARIEPCGRPMKVVGDGDVITDR
ncbi:hypothetical protein SAMN05216207_10392 [Pseudonocardia ammonioxydans]|uniref:Uncharacterized protein n=1 Tax=Pseudonocardia ammonioxydans TaxID=260086 RepID=A0A1I5FM76_PSUAM|nr:hypothetical protein SAMN05216207_10392 [Pseudonocardia ammonioxydans]